MEEEKNNNTSAGNENMTDVAVQSMHSNNNGGEHHSHHHSDNDGEHRSHQHHNSSDSEHHSHHHHSSSDGEHRSHRHHSSSDGEHHSHRHHSSSGSEHRSHRHHSSDGHRSRHHDKHQGNRRQGRHVHESNPHDRKSKKKKIWMIVLAVIAGIVLLVGAFTMFAYFSMKRDIDENQLGMLTDLDPNVMNIAFFGVDGRADAPGDRSDATILVSVDFTNGDIKIISVQRDTLLQIPATSDRDVSYEKLNHAYSYGGPEMAIRAINESFDLNISNYMTVNFDGLEGAVNAIGGIDIDIADEDLLYDINKNMPTDKQLKNIGKNHIDGEQALAYCRVRYIDSDFGRTERQRQVISGIVQKALSINMLTAVRLAVAAFPYIETSFSLPEMLSLYQRYMSVSEHSIQSSRVPYDTLRTNADIDSLSYIIPTTLADNARVLHHFLYNGSEYTPSMMVESISATIESISGYGSSVNWGLTDCEEIINSQRITDQH